jgi:hypothetical protein
MGHVRRCVKDPLILVFHLNHFMPAVPQRTVRIPCYREYPMLREYPALP